MTINDVEVRQAENNEVTVGVVSEYDIRVAECTRECEIDGETKRINSAWIGGSIIIEANGNAIRHSFRYLDTIRHKKNGDENKVFKGLMTALGYDVEFNSQTKKLVYNKTSEGLIPKVEGKITFVDINKNVVNTEEIKRTGEPTRVKVSSKLSLNEALNKDQSDLVFYNELPVSYISTTNVPDTDSAMFTVEGVIKDIVDEYDNNGGTTGRYLIDLVVPNYFGVDVFNFVMLDKWTNVVDGEDIEVTKEMFYNATDEANSFCKAGDTVKLSGDIEGHSFGSVATVSDAKKTFGGGAKNVKSGFTRIEWTIKAADFVEDSEQYDTEIITKALEEREIILDNHYKQRLEDYNTMNAGKTETKPSVKGSANGGTSPFGGSAPKSSPFGNGKKSPFG